MGISDWINLVAVILVGGGTITLAFMTWKAIRQTRAIQKSERRERLLNEIIEWAIDTINCEFKKHHIREDINLDLKGYKPSPDMENLLEVADLGDMGIKFERLRVKSLYIRKIASNFGLDLQRPVGDLINNLVEHLKLFGKCQEAVQIPNDFPTAFEELGKNKVVLDDCAEKVIEEAAKIKTENIGKQEGNMPKEVEGTESIEEHLKRQDRQTKRMIYFAGAAFGASIILVAASLWIGRLTLSATAFFWQYIFLLAVGFGFMFWCWYKQSKVK